MCHIIVIMLVKNVDGNKDKGQILKFCKDTFSWGDYIDSVWDFWIKEGNFLCIYDNDEPIGICHASISNESKQLWIEGIRINPEFRRKHLATRLVLKSESIGIKNLCDTSYMLIENTNTQSLTLAKNLNYTVDEVWNFHSIQNTTNIQNTDAHFVTSISEISDFISKSLKFANSWRLYPFNSIFVDSLISNKYVICVNSGSVCSMATMIPSIHFDNTLLVTILHGNQSGIDKIIKFVQNYGLLYSVSRIQLLINDKIIFKNDDQYYSYKKMIFNLMQKNLS